MNFFFTEVGAMNDGGRVGHGRDGNAFQNPHPGNANAPLRCLSAYLLTDNYFPSVYNFNKSHFYRSPCLG